MIFQDNQVVELIPVPNALGYLSLHPYASLMSVDINLECLILEFKENENVRFPLKLTLQPWFLGNFGEIWNQFFFINVNTRTVTCFTLCSSPEQNTSVDCLGSHNH
jgi:hypothetical protein